MSGLDDANVTERCEGRGLDDDTVTGHKGLEDLPEHEEDGEVPGCDTGTDTERKVSLDSLVAFVLVEDVLVEADLGEFG